MSEQQRIFATVALCLGILLIWQFFYVKPEADKKPKPVAATPAKTPGNTNTTPAVTPAPPSVAPAAAEALPAAEATPEVVSETRRPIATPLYSGELSNLGASIPTRLELKGTTRSRRSRAERGRCRWSRPRRTACYRSGLVELES